MTKFEETLDVIHHYVKEMPKKGTNDELNNSYLCGIAMFLCDISKSLAILADSSEFGKMLVQADEEKEGKE